MIKIKCLEGFAGSNLSMYLGQEKIVDDKVIDITNLLNVGYVEILEEIPVKTTEETAEETTEETTVDFKNLKKDELIALAVEKGIEVPEKATKEEIIQLVANNEN